MRGPAPPRRDAAGGPAAASAATLGSADLRKGFCFGGVQAEARRIAGGWPLPQCDLETDAQHEVLDVPQVFVERDAHVHARAEPPGADVCAEAELVHGFLADAVPVHADEPAAGEADADAEARAFVPELAAVDRDELVLIDRARTKPHHRRGVQPVRESASVPRLVVHA